MTSDPSLGAILFWGIITFSFLVVIHEGGHFLAARLFGVKVHEFMIGLPGPALRFKGKKTTFGVTVVPLGGYVRIAGMEPGGVDELLAPALGAIAEAGAMDAEELSRRLDIGRERAGALLTTLADWGALSYAPDKSGRYGSRVPAYTASDPQAALNMLMRSTYRGKKTWQRVLILSTGVLMNLLAAILTFTVVLSVFGYYVPTLDIARVEKGSAAAAAGLKAGDRVVSFDGERVAEWQALLDRLADKAPGDTVTIEVKRGSRVIRTDAVLSEREGKPFLGVGSAVVKRRPNPLLALAESFRWTGAVFVAIVRLFMPGTFVSSIKDARSVVGISVEVARAAETGPLDYAWLVALLSLSLGAINILPIPPLDGGKVLMEFIERVVRRPISRRLYLGVSTAGALFLFSLIGYLMYADVVRLMSG